MNIKKNLSRDLFVMNFVQFVSAPQTHAKRVRKIKKTMETCPANLTETQWMKMWRGFYYVIWYSEMRKGGEELIEEMGSYQNGSYLLSGFKSLTEAWGGIDAFRIDKYMFLVRHMLQNVLSQQIVALVEDKLFLEANPFLDQVKNKLHASETKTLVIDYLATVTSNSIGFFLHICDIYLDELVKAVQKLVEGDNVAKSEIYYQMVIPFARRLSTIGDERLRKSIRSNIFDKLLDEVLIKETISMRVDTLNKFIEPLVEIASHTDSGKNRNCLYSLTEKIRSQVKILQCPAKDRVHLKRKVIGMDRKTKKVKYEVGTSVPFVRSLVPLPLM